MQYDYLIVGAGLFGAVCARELTDAGKRCLVLEKRNHIAGNCYTKEVEGIQVHWYGGHIFHTSDREVWEYANRFASFNHYINSPVANYKGKLYNLPFNMNTFYQLWGTVTPEAAQEKIRQQVAESGITAPQNLEEQALSLVGRDVYETLIRGYTEKQWGRPCRELPAFIIRRLPVRFRFDNNYFNDPWQGIPTDGYTNLVQRMLEGIEVRLNTDYLTHKAELDVLAEHVIYTGPIDQYFEYRFGALEWRGLRFEIETLNRENYQGVAAVNYTDAETPYTRILEHKHFTFGTQPKTVITREYPAAWKRGEEPYYPVNDPENQHLYTRYQALAETETRVTFGGRLGEYQYYDMDKVMRAALETVRRLKQGGSHT